MGLFDKLFGKKEEAFDPNHIFAPMAGQTVPVAEVPDPTFAQGILGEGIAIIPADGKVYAPCNATVDTMILIIPLCSVPSKWLPMLPIRLASGSVSAASWVLTFPCCLPSWLWVSMNCLYLPLPCCLFVQPSARALLKLARWRCWSADACLKYLKPMC